MPLERGSLQRVKLNEMGRLKVGRTEGQTKNRVQEE